ncbi:2-polyprenyl-6-methoxyphenol hydroxylase-like FAD-dependent oxidoreductase [Microbacterium resistens]|uniref:2-polyprenyl-6-methoxyphenol hydroxylase-like FAD-dependent oxidoreductase n=1 Tax=Microbacterium resistens TaxID=156977 RepID=A0ABU1SEG4_9MICO|nr:FAD-dependent monooxygenase [Microbacterium resistens]MDR6868002.1 2-polyprenyl-6-methoxyphenol hydroxylase-like FAD-dependent oxidoreductase [Microbacterium resistens]
MRIAIVGAGIGGLCAAAGLQRSGAEVAVFEQSPGIRPGGSGLTVFGNGLTALDSIGRGEAFRAVTTAEAGVLRGGQRRPDGSWLSTFPADELTGLRVVERVRLHELLASAISPDAFRLGHRVIEAAQDGRVTTIAADGARREEPFDLVVGADGLRSAIRASWPQDPGTVYAGYSAWRGITERPVDLRGEAGETWGVGRRFGVAPLPDGRVYWFAVLSVRQGHRFDDHAETLNELFGHWHRPIPELIAATPPSAIQYHPIEELAGRLPSFVRGRTVLLGDAAHAMTPNLGQGGGQAMEDAATLTALLSPFAAAAPDAAELKVALRRYDELRVSRSQRVARRSRAVGRLAHVPGRTLSSVRDLVVRATPASALRRQLAWLQDWTPPA